MSNKIINSIVENIPLIVRELNISSPLFKIYFDVVQEYFNKSNTLNIKLLSNMIWTKIELGNICSYDILHLNELIILKFYELNTHRYKNFLDLGANIGLHSIFCSKHGYKVTSVEPDPINIELFMSNLDVNNINNINLIQKAISNKVDTVKFIHVNDNYTGSHILGEKDSYGEKTYFEVETTRFENLNFTNGLVKMDIEGHESVVLKSLDISIFDKCDFIVEIHGEYNQKEVFDYFINTNINIFSQKIKFNKVSTLNEMPIGHQEGTLFISKKSKMPW